MMCMNHMWISHVCPVLMSIKRRGCQGAEVLCRKRRYMPNEVCIKRSNCWRHEGCEEYLLRENTSVTAGAKKGLTNHWLDATCSMKSASMLCVYE